jgi:hypothetical protein
MLRLLKQRIPSPQQILAVYGIIALLIHGWTLIIFFWKLPSWGYFLTFGEIFTAFAYSMAMNLLECFSIVLALLLLSIILPSSWFRNVFASRATVMVILFLAYMMYVALHITSASDIYPANLVRLAPVVGVVILIVAFFVGWITPVRKLIDGLAERAIIFSYILLPVGVISFLVVLARNIF